MRRTAILERRGRGIITNTSRALTVHLVTNTSFLKYRLVCAAVRTTTCAVSKPTLAALNTHKTLLMS